MISDLRKMKFYLRLLTYIVVMVSLLMLTSILGNAQVKVHTFKFGGSNVIGSIEDKANELFINLVETRSKGQIKVVYAPANQLGTADEIIEYTISGSVDIFSGSTIWYSEWVKDFNILGWGFVFRDKEHIDKFFESPIFTEMTDKLREENGIRIIAATRATPRTLFTAKPVFTIDDLEGMKLRVAGIEMFIELWKALGTAPVSIAWAEVYLALKTGGAVGVEAAIPTIYPNRFHEVAHYITLSSHVWEAFSILINEKKYQDLSSDLQKIVNDAAREALNTYRNMYDEEESKCLDKMINEGAFVIRTDLTPWKEKVSKATLLMEEKGFWSKGLFERVQKIE
jgi:tripartite ATP-independent transporter DctP family solute receptor